MPGSKYKFEEQQSCDHDIRDADDSSKIGLLRVKPSSILWKPKGAHQFFVVELDKFSSWIARKGKLVDK